VNPSEYLDKLYLSRNWINFRADDETARLRSLFVWKKHKNVMDGETNRITLAIAAVGIASNADAL